MTTALQIGICLLLFVKPKENTTNQQRKNKRTNIDRLDTANERN